MVIKEAPENFGLEIEFVNQAQEDEPYLFCPAERVI
jgi:hypothetical protein